MGDSGSGTSAGATSGTSGEERSFEGALSEGFAATFVGAGFDFDTARAALSRTVIDVPGPARGGAGNVVFEGTFVFGLSLSTFPFSATRALDPAVGCVNVDDAVRVGFAAGAAAVGFVDVPLLDEAPADDASFFAASSLAAIACSGIAGVDLLVEMTRGRIGFEEGATGTAATLPLSSTGSFVSGIRSTRRAPPTTRSFFSTDAPSSAFNENTAGRRGPVRTAFVVDELLG